MSCGEVEDLQEGSSDSKEENSVKNIASMFNQPNQSAGMARPAVAAKPTVGSKPSVLAKPPGKLDLNSSIKIIGPNVRSPRFEKPSNGAVKSPSKDSLKRDSPKPAAAPAKAPVGGPVMPGTNMAEILNMRNMLKKAPVPAPSPTTSQSEPRVDFKRSLKKSPVAPPTRTTPSLHQKTAPPSQGTDEMDTSSKENISTSKSEGDCSSLSSFTSDSSIPRRGSATSQKTTGDNQKPILEILPPLETIGPAPRKPAKPVNVKLPKSAAMPPSANPEPIDSGADSGEIYDDVAVETNKRFSLIPTMDSDEETGDDIYDDTEVVPSAPLPPLPACLSIPTIAQTSGPDDGPQEIYDDVSLEGESEELYEALDVSTEDAQQKRPSIESSDSADVASRPTTTPSSLLSPRKTMSTKKQEEKQRKEQERLEKERRKKEEEMRKKREKEEKKRKEKEEKEMKKKFNIKGEIQVLDSGTVTQDCGSDYERTDLICKRGDRLEVLRRDGNPPGKWLARDLQGRYGFVDADFVAIETDFQEPYDDVIPCDGSGSEEEEEQEIYEAFD
ncbi:FYN-binding protein 1-like isoform X3 [Patiria miniata]|uniref:Helically-extended SH3 domain-containing protein n=1 Tax=Patiria miniata TaxID=46514 RepID=A0A914AWZ4_PATMI|nr:FYN-binding protein 1-like isoform X3 [Patiria miniata]